MDRLSLDQALEVGLLQARSLSVLEQQIDIIALSLDNLFSSQADDKEGEKDLVAIADVSTTEAEPDTQRAEANEPEVVDDTITTHEANEDEVVDDAIRADGEVHDEDLPITPAADAGHEKDEGEDDDDEDDDDSPSLPDAGKDLDGDDDEEDDDDDFMIQYHEPTSALKGVSLRDSSSQGEKKRRRLSQRTKTPPQNTKVLLKKEISKLSSNLSCLKILNPLGLQ
ncbi:pheromone-processing carboxypeptidase KEX1-like [Cynara cardunculus var. scolymus]|uniref:pheromone-processing carboxypeptidase KEX1-like n=1 Tax=Cynara cardunculus var. scolymus TaxID=59895 RepID=UPI000D62F7BA|nr:pheromone-processing carboxypeptidase KEX1-like [Cynara cardunculus var. scolymus]